MARRCTQHRRWFITGVSRGFGRALAEEALKRGHFVAGTVRDEESARRFEATAPGRSLAYWADVTHEEQLCCALSRACKALGGLDLLCNNAGFSLPDSPLHIEESALRAYWEVHYWARLRAVRILLPKFKQRGHGHFVDVSRNGPSNGLYESLAAELTGTPIRLTEVDLQPSSLQPAVAQILDSIDCCEREPLARLQINRT